MKYDFVMKTNKQSRRVEGGISNGKRIEVNRQRQQTHKNQQQRSANKIK